jgi:hypothetical protein
MGVTRLLKQFDRPVRCSRGHLFTTTWVPLASVKAVRLGRRRFQYCPVGHHWALVEPVDRSATAAVLQAAASVRDVRLP